MSKDDYESMQETLYLHSIPGLVEKILELAGILIKDLKLYHPARLIYPIL